MTFDRKELTTIPYVQMQYKATVEKRLTEAGFVIGNVTGKATEDFTGDAGLRGEVRPELPAGPDAAR